MDDTVLLNVILKRLEDRARDTVGLQEDCYRAEKEIERLQAQVKRLNAQIGEQAEDLEWAKAKIEEWEKWRRSLLGKTVMPKAVRARLPDPPKPYLNRIPF